MTLVDFVKHLALLREIPDRIADWCARYVMNVHRMTAVGAPPEPWCMRCDAPWPCDEFMKAAQSIGRRP